MSAYGFKSIDGRRSILVVGLVLVFSLAVFFYVRGFKNDIGVDALGSGPQEVSPIASRVPARQADPGHYEKARQPTVASGPKPEISDKNGPSVGRKGKKLRGIVLDQKGQKLAKASIAVFPLADDRPQSRAHKSTQSITGGFFSLAKEGLLTVA